MHEDMHEAMHGDRYSYLMMFCALMMVRNSRATLAQFLEVHPLSGRVNDFAGMLAHADQLAASQPASQNDEPSIRPPSPRLS
ncbi:MAG: hypothetical protein EXQ56_10655 [Acidobacteria bacterium]|nr:hypothetical protein [Acidobacteriota bacterium]